MTVKHTFSDLRLSLFPTAAVVVTSVNNRGDVGATTVGWNGVISSRPAVLSISLLPDSFTRSCIEESREFVVNVPDARFVKETNFLGSLSGPWEKKASGLTPPELASLTLVASSNIRSPIINEFYLNFECRSLQTHRVGLYDCYFGQVLAMHCSDEAFLANHKKGNVQHAQFQPILCLGDEYWSGGKYFGTSTENKIHPHGNEH